MNANQKVGVASSFKLEVDTLDSAIISGYKTEKFGGQVATNSSARYKGKAYTRPHAIRENTYKKLEVYLLASEKNKPIIKWVTRNVGRDAQTVERKDMVCKKLDESEEEVLEFEYKDAYPYDYDVDASLSDSTSVSKFTLYFVAEEIDD